HRFLRRWTAPDFRIGWERGHQALGCPHTAGAADFERHRLAPVRGPMERRRGHHPRRRAVAGLARAVLGRNRRLGSEGKRTDQTSLTVANAYRGSSYVQE